MKAKNKNIAKIDPQIIENRRERPIVSIVIPAYNEEEVIEKNLSAIVNYMESIEKKYSWEIVVVDDGSIDGTGKLADEYAASRKNIHVLHHFTNFQLGQALRYAFSNCQGDYIVVMDLDLSYSPKHIEKLLDAIQETRAKIVIASPYMKGGKITNVPLLRRILSVWANRFLGLTAKGKISTITGMVRAYDREFISNLNTKAMDMGINPEIIYKAQLLRARIKEIPAHLDWSAQNEVGKKRRSSMKIIWNILSSLFSGFIFRPFMFFILPGLFSLLLALYPIIWTFIHTFTYLGQIPSSSGSFDYRLSDAISLAFNQAPHAFFIGGIALMVGLQLISLGVLALQSKRYFEESFHLSSAIYKYIKTNKNRYEENSKL